MFYWGAKKLPNFDKRMDLREPLRTIMITTPKKYFYDIYYNHMTSSDQGKMEFVNRLVNNSSSVGWQNNFSLMSRIDNKSHYENLNQRTLIVPVIHVRPTYNDNPQ
jgi:hypothetical protein